jgi:membrane protein YdbS with pleckstrin-like domain
MKNKKDKEFKCMIVLPFIAVLLLIAINSLIIKPELTRYIVIIDLVGLILLVLGTVFGLRPLVRNIISPNVDRKEREKLNRNAAIIAFVYIIVGFALQMSSKMLLLTNINYPGIITLGIGAVALYYTIRTLKEFKIIPNN